MSLISGVSPSSLYRGVAGSEENIQGWFSPREREIVPNDACFFELSEQSHGAFATLLSFSSCVCADIGWSSVNATGRNARLRWTDEGGIHTLLIARDERHPMDIAYEYKKHEFSDRLT
jgi:hypothetical protein